MASGRGMGRHYVSWVQDFSLQDERVVEMDVVKAACSESLLFFRLPNHGRTVIWEGLEREEREGGNYIITL